MRKAFFYFGMIFLIAAELGCVGAMVVEEDNGHLVSVRVVQAEFFIAYCNYEIGFGCHKTSRVFSDTIEFAYDYHPSNSQSLSDELKHKGFGYAYDYDTYSFSGINIRFAGFVCVIVYPLVLFEVLGWIVYFKYHKRKRVLALIESQEEES